jgi:hypothetical protein
MKCVFCPAKRKRGRSRQPELAAGIGVLDASLPILPVKGEAKSKRIFSLAKPQRSPRKILMVIKNIGKRE